MKVLFVGTRLEACNIVSEFCGNYDLELKVITFEGSFIQKYYKRDVFRTLALKKSLALYELLNHMKVDPPDLFLSVGLPYILPADFFELSTTYVNSHPHILPERKGFDVIKKSFAGGAKPCTGSHHIL
ncbi:MAG: hypothetical protein L7F78_03100 [Syntrophales bacterium LBB04]|nr:hypothetical protein [Syntrophales bacterium LBB04]